MLLALVSHAARSARPYYAGHLGMARCWQDLFCKKGVLDGVTTGGRSSTAPRTLARHPSVSPNFSRASRGLGGRIGTQKGTVRQRHLPPLTIVAFIASTVFALVPLAGYPLFSNRGREDTQRLEIRKEKFSTGGMGRCRASVDPDCGPPSRRAPCDSQRPSSRGWRRFDSSQCAAPFRASRQSRRSSCRVKPARAPAVRAE